MNVKFFKLLHLIIIQKNYNAALWRQTRRWMQMLARARHSCPQECRAHASIYLGRRVWHHNTALNTWNKFTFMQRQSPTFIYLYFFLGRLTFPNDQPYVKFVIISLRFAYQWHFKRIFSQTVYVMKEPEISISKYNIHVCIE